MVVDTSFLGRQLMRELDRLIAYRGRLLIVSVNGTELTSHAILS